MDSEQTKSEATIEPSKPFSQRRKFLCALIFIIGLPLSYPTVFPFGLACTSFLLFQKSKTAVWAGLFLVIVQFLLLVFFGFIYAIPPFQPYAS